MNSIFANDFLRKGKGDVLRWELERQGKNVNDVYIATAFFTYSDFVEYLVDNGCTIRLIVRLDYPTSAESLRRIFHKGNVSICYYRGREFHPKLYIFGNKTAFVGSSNLTHNGLTVNQELNISVDSEDPLFDELRVIFSEYWHNAEALTQETLNKYSQEFSRKKELYTKAQREIDNNEIEEVVYPNIKRVTTKKRKRETIFENNFRKRYKLFLDKFEVLTGLYKSVDRRKIPESRLHLRLEIDQFLSWIIDKKATRNSYKDAPTRQGKELRDFIIPLINEFLDSDFDYIEEVVISSSTIRDNLSSESKIEVLTEQEIKDTVKLTHSFNEQLRRRGEVLLENFIEENGINKIKYTLKYLLFGEDDYIKRMSDCIFDPEYQLKYFKESCVQEIYGSECVKNSETKWTGNLKSIRMHHSG